MKLLRKNVIETLLLLKGWSTKNMATDLYHFTKVKVLGGKSKVEAQKESSEEINKLI